MSPHQNFPAPPGQPVCARCSCPEDVRGNVLGAPDPHVRRWVACPDPFHEVSSTFVVGFDGSSDGDALVLAAPALDGPVREYRPPTVALLEPPVTCVQSGTNAQLVDTVRRLYPLDGRVLDMTHGTAGGFWKLHRPEGLVAITGESGIDFRSTPYAAGSFDHVVFDPPYVAKGGHDTSTLGDMNVRYGMLHVEKDPAAQWELQIVPGIIEAARLVRPKQRVGRRVQPGGLLWLKCMDYVTGGRVHWFTKLALDVLDDAGFDLVDEFILNGKPGPQPKTNPDGSVRRQVHARRAHSVLMIARRRGVQV